MPKRRRPRSEERGLILHREGLRHVPENEQGVVYLFAKMAKRLGFPEIIKIQQKFPDCWATKRVGKKTQEVWIEFEFRSGRFKSHVTKRQAQKYGKKNGYVVCWEHNWQECEKYAKVIELRRELAFGTRVWIQSILPRSQKYLDKVPRKRSSGHKFSVNKNAKPGDLVLMYRPGSRSKAREHGADEDKVHSIANVFLVKSPPKHTRSRAGWMAEVIQIARLKYPLYYEKMKTDRFLKSSPFIRKNMRGRIEATAYWYRIYDLILDLNRDRRTKKALKEYRPEVM